ncbi:Tetratricopeptide-like helical domain superfamily [Sesbania bispinosa]|nr:Tetratricopeptide-like helical domain superfamily [Sesbania bispinosa]
MYQSLRAQRLLYCSHISYYVKAGIIDKAIHVFDKMTQSNCPLFNLDYNRFIGVLLRHSRFDLAQHYYYRHVIPSSFSLLPFTSSRFISALCSVKDFALIHNLLQDMEALGFVPDIWAFNIYLNLLCRENHLETALQLFRTMPLKGRHPDVVTYTIIIDALCNSKRFDEAARFWRALIDKGLSPDYKACAALVVGLCGGGNVELAYELIVSVINRGLTCAVTLQPNEARFPRRCLNSVEERDKRWMRDFE